MAELEVDQSNLPRVQEVCQCFAVLEDGALAHNLQEQEIEHYYTTNIQKNQLVQNDIRIAKRLQDEEEEQQRTLLRQASRQLEEQDSEYARMIQEEIQRCAEEARRREQEDEEIAKRIQEEEEEEERIRTRTRGHESLSDDDVNGPTLSSPQQHTLHNQGEGQHYACTATRWQCSTSCSLSHSSVSQAEIHMREEALKTYRSNEGHTDSIRQIRDELREPLSENSDAVFSEHPPPWSQRSDNRPTTLHCRMPALCQPCERDLGSVHSRSSSSSREGQRGWEEGSAERNGVFENGGWADNGARNNELEMNPREQVEGRRSNRGRKCSLGESFRVHTDRPTELSKTWTCRESPDKRVHFRDDGYHGNSRSVWEMLGQVLRERGVAVRHGVPGAPLKLDLQSRNSQVFHCSEVSFGDAQPRRRPFQRSATARRSYHGDVGERRSSSYQADIAEAHRGERERRRDCVVVVEEDETDVCEELSPYSDAFTSERGREGPFTHRARSCREEERGYSGNHGGRVGRSRSEHHYLYGATAESLRSQEVDKLRRTRAPRRSQSFSGNRVSVRAVPRHTRAGAAVHKETCLDLRELQQVLQDEHLARRLQEEEEERLLRRSPRPSSTLRSSYPEGDFRVAQVAQDEEIARFIQKQEIKTKRRSRELEGPGSWREHREMMSHRDERAVRDRQVQRERLDSEGLPSPTEDFSFENQPPSPISTLIPGQRIRNIAEELDPTFKARRQDKYSLRAGQMDPACQSDPISQPGLHDFLDEPAFIPPTKRQSDKSARTTTKAKEKKENCKQQ